MHGNREIGRYSLIFNEFFVIKIIEVVFQSVGIMPDSKMLLNSFNIGNFV